MNMIFPIVSRQFVVLEIHTIYSKHLARNVTRKIKDDIYERRSNLFDSIMIHEPGIEF